MAQSYENAGVNLEAGYEVVRRIKQHVASTTRTGSMGNIGSFGGMFDLSALGVKEPVLVSGTDGVGTKLKIAFLMDRHDTVGQDCVAMCVNDVICAGAKPIYFLDYIACGRNVPERIASIVKGVADGCVLAGCALIGGETAEMPGFYPVDEYDLAGCCTGIVDRDRILKPETMQEGDILIALPSSGVHSNGFSLVRRVFDVENTDLKTPRDDLDGRSLGETLLAPTRIYVKPVLRLLESVHVRSISHITGGGFYENIPRSIPDGLCAVVDRSLLRIPAIFRLIQKQGKIDERDMFNTFNMGVGMAIVVPAAEADEALSILKDAGEDAYIMGSIQKAPEKIRIQ